MEIMKMLGLGLVAVLAASPHFNVAASFVPPSKRGANGAIAVTFVAKDPDVHINEEPAPRIALDPSQNVLVDKQAPPSRTQTFDPEKAKYLDLSVPVSFPVSLAPGATKGPHTLAGSVTFFYCSKREGWCRKGTSAIEVAVTVP